MSEQPMTDAEIIAGMLKVLPDHRRWCKDAYETQFGRHCLLGAYVKVTGEHQSTRGTLAPALQRIARIAREQYPERMPAWLPDDGYAITCFNDDDRTRFTDIRLVLEKAAACEEMQEE